jgi:hypothetical protein
MSVMRNTALEGGVHMVKLAITATDCAPVSYEEALDPAMVRQIGRILQQDQRAATPLKTGSRSLRATMVTRVPPACRHGAGPASFGKGSRCSRARLRRLAASTG